MSTPSITWANICRKANGEHLIEHNNQLETPLRVCMLKKHAFPFMALPSALRSNILHHVLDRETIAVFLPGRWGKDPPTQIPLPPPARAGDRTLRLEMLRIVIMNTTFEIHSGPGNEKFQTWLRGIRFVGSGVETSYKDGFDAVKRLRFPYFSKYQHRTLPSTAPNRDVELMRKCERLEEVQLAFFITDLWDEDEEGWWWKQPETLVREYRLEGMLELKSLKVLRLVGCEETFESPAMQALWWWFGNEFQKKKDAGGRARSVEVVRDVRSDGRR